MPRFDQPEEEADVLTVQEVAKRLAVNEKTVYRYIEWGLVEVIKLPGKGKRIRRTELDRLLAQTTKTQAQQPHQETSFSKSPCPARQSGIRSNVGACILQLVRMRG